MTIVLNSNNLKDITISFQKKCQKQQRTDQVTNNAYNYYIQPKLAIKLYNAQVSLVNERYIVFVFDKFRDSSLLVLLKNISSSILRQLERVDSVNVEQSFPVFSETETLFTIRCSLPSFRGKYHIQQFEDGTLQQFRLPRTKATIESVQLEIRNLWVLDNRLGFNLELKIVEY